MAERRAAPPQETILSPAQQPAAVQYRPMIGLPHFGLILALTIRGLAVGDYRDMRQVAATAEAVGFDSIWLCDHFLTLTPASYAQDAGMNGGGLADDAPTGPSRSMPLLECWTALSALARDTTRLRLGTSVLCNSYRDRKSVV